MTSFFYLGLIVSFSARVIGQQVEPKIESAVPHIHGSLSEADQSLLSSLTFQCAGRGKGYYVDEDFQCMVFHFCDESGKIYSYKCKEGKKFDKVTLSCVYYIGDECNSKTNRRSKEVSINEKIENIVKNNDSIKRGKLTYSERKFIEKDSHSPESLATLTAFATLAQNSDKEIDHMDTDVSGSDKIERFYGSRDSSFKSSKRQEIIDSHPSHPYPFHSSSASPRDSIYNEITKDDIYTDSTVKSPLQSDSTNSQRFYENYHPYPGTLSSPAKQVIPINAPRSFYHPSAFGRKVFDYYPSTTEGYGNINNGFSTPQHPEFIPPKRGQLLKEPPRSHFNFSPPGSEFSFKHDNIKKTIHDDVVFHGTLFSNKDHQDPRFSHLNRNPSHTQYRQISNPNVAPKRKPPSIFASPTPRSFSTSVSNLNLVRNNQNSGLNKPQNIYIEDIPSTPFANLPNYNPQYYYDDTLNYQDSISPQNPDILYHEHLPTKIYSRPETFSHFPDAADIPIPSSRYTHNSYKPEHLNSPLKSRKTIIYTKSSKRVKDTNSNIYPDPTYPIKIDNKKPKVYIKSDPVIHVPRNQGNIEYNQELSLPEYKKHIESDKEYTPRRVKQKSENLSPITTEGPIRFNQNENKFDPEYIDDVSRDVDVTTYSPPLKTKLTEKPIKKIVTPSRTLRRKNTGNKIRGNRRRQNIPKTENIDYPEEKAKEIIVIEKDKAPEIHEISDITLVNEDPITTTPQTVSKSSTSSPLRGTLKERLNRLGSRRQSLSRSRSRVRNRSRNNVQTTTSAGIAEEKNEPQKQTVPKTIKIVKEPKEKEKETEINPNTAKRLKNRVSSFYKERTQGRSRPRTIRRRLSKNRTAIQKTDPTADNKETEPVDIEIDEKKPDNALGEVAKVSQVKEEVSKIDEAKHIEKDQSSDPMKKLANRKKRPMNPNVRERFKAFLKNRKTRVNGLNRPAKKEDQELSTEPSNTEESNIDMKSKDVNNTEVEKETDIKAEESEIMEKSIPLVREKKVVLLEENFQYPFDIRQKRLSDHIVYPKSTINYDEQSILSHPSAKPFRYMLNKNKKHEHNEEEIQNTTPEVGKTETTTIKSLADRLLDSSKDFHKITAITKHTVVRPSNFKQIVRMHPRNPTDQTVPITSSERTPSKVTPSIFYTSKKSFPDASLDPMKSTEENTHIMVHDFSTDENEIHADDESSIVSEKSISVNNVKATKSHPETQSSKAEVLTPMDVLPEINEVFPMDETEDDASSSTNKAKPVFNLDSVSESINANSKEEHISASDNNGFKTKINSIKFEPFTMSNEEPLLPIQRLLQFN